MAKPRVVLWFYTASAALLLAAKALHAQTSPATLPDLRLSKAGYVATMVRQPDGKIIIGGSFASVNGIDRANLARLNPDGSLDATWAPQSDGYVSSLALSGNDLYLGGRFTSIDGQDRYGLAKASTLDGQVASDWNPSTDYGNEISALLVSGTNIYVGGSFQWVGGQAHTNIARLSTSSPGLSDGSWSPSANGPVFGFALSGTNVYVGGAFTAIGGQNRKHIAKLNTVGIGSADTQWNPSVAPAQTNTEILYGSVIGIIPDGASVFLCGYFDDVAGQNRYGLAKVSALGAGDLDLTWNPPTNEEAYSMALNGTNLFVGTADFVFRLETSGTGQLNTNWEQRLIGYGGCNVILADGNDTALYVGGGFATLNGDLSCGVAKLDQVSGAHDRAYDVQIEVLAGINAMSRQPDGKTILGGDFWRANGLVRRHVLRLNGDGSLDAGWAPALDGRTVDAVAVDGTNIFIGGDFQTVGGHLRYGLAKLRTASDADDPNWNPIRWLSQIRALAVIGTNLFFAGGLPSDYLPSGVFGLRNLAKASTLGTGAVDHAWAPNPDGLVQALASDGTNLFVGGSFYQIGGRTITNVAKLGVFGNGQADPLWNPHITLPASPVPGFPPQVYALALDGTNLFIGGVFDAVGGQMRSGLAKAKTSGDGAVDIAWNPAPTYFPGQPASIYALAVGGTNLYIGGAFQFIGGQPRAALARLSTTESGMADASWQRNVAVAIQRNTLQVVGAAGADLFVGASFLGSNGVLRSGLIFLPVADAPVIFQSSNSTLILSRNAADGPEVTHFWITNITGGSLYQNDGLTAIHNGDFITVDQSSAGLQFVGTNSTASITAFSSLNNTPAGAGSASTILSFNVPQPPIFSFTSTNYVVLENIPGAVAILTVTKIRPGTGSVSFALQPGSADFYDANLGTGDFTNFTTSPLMFNSSDTSKDIRIFINNDNLFEGDETFTVTLTGVTGGGIIAFPAMAVVTIRDDDCPGPQGSLTNIVLPSAIPAVTAGLRVDIQGATNGQWRLAGDPYWRDSGAAAIGLSSGYYVVDFKSVVGFQASGSVTVLVEAGKTNAIIGLYTTNSSRQLGNLIVRISPDAVATNSAQWKVPGGSWHASGESVTLGAGAYQLEFSPVANWVSPRLSTVVVGANQDNIRPVAYQTNNAPGAATPQVLSFTSVTNPPYLYNGLIETDLGFGSGVVVKPRVVLTAAHVLFDDVVLSYSKAASWFFQKHRDVYEPRGQTARGWYIFDGYAAQRKSDGTPGISSTASQNLDAAALYFIEIDEPVYDPNLPGRGGAGGFLASDVLPNPWLSGAALKMLVGYPLDGVAETNWGKMHATVPANVSFANVSQDVYATSDIKSFPGNSGGPLYVQTNGQYYPAGIYLGGGAQTYVRAIDKTVVCLINLAEITANGGGNFTSGGVTLFSPGVNVSAFSGGLITAALTPAAAVRAGARWRVNRGSGDVSAWFTNGSQVVTEGNGTYPIEFNSITGFLAPGPTAVSVLQPNSIYSVPGVYSPVILLSSAARLPDGSFRLSLSGTTGQVYNLQAAANLGPTNWTTLATLSNSMGTVQFTNTTATNFSQRFFRALQVQ